MNSRRLLDRVGAQRNPPGQRADKGAQRSRLRVAHLSKSPLRPGLPIRVTLRLWEEPVRMRQDDVPDFVPKFLDLLLKLPDFVSDLALKFPDLVPKLLNLISKRRMA
jgi:hypothetical protein